MTSADTKIDKGHSGNSLARKVMCIHQEDYLEKFELLAGEGDAEAAYCIGYHFLKKKGRRAESIGWLRKGAQLGSRKAQSLVAQLLEPSNRNEAARWYNEAAFQGDDFSLAWLALASYREWIKSENEEKLIYAYVFRELSGRPGFVTADENGYLRDICLENKLSPAQLVEARNLILNLRSKIPNLPEKRASRSKSNNDCDPG